MCASLSNMLLLRPESNVSKGAKESNARHARMSYYLDPKFENRDVLPWLTTGVFSELEFAEATC